jgi:hypothetical protein
MEAALRLAHDLQVDLAPRPDIVPTPPFPTGGEGEQQQDDAKRALFTSHLLRMRAAQAQLLEVTCLAAAAAAPPPNALHTPPTHIYLLFYLFGFLTKWPSPPSPPSRSK